MPQEAKNGDFRELFPISTPSFPTTCMGFEPPKDITLHLIVFKMLESIIRQGFYTYSASPKYLNPFSHTPDFVQRVKRV
jgi:hypothetical protein